MDNNASERVIRGPAMGRKNYYGLGFTMERLFNGRHVFDFGDAQTLGLESAALADMVFGEVVLPLGASYPPTWSRFYRGTFRITAVRTWQIVQVRVPGLTLLECPPTIDTSSPPPLPNNLDGFGKGLLFISPKGLCKIAQG